MVLSRSTLSGSGPASSPPCAGHRVTVMTGGSGNAPGPSRSSRNSLSPLMLRGWKRGGDNSAAPDWGAGHSHPEHGDATTVDAPHDDWGPQTGHSNVPTQPRRVSLTPWGPCSPRTWVLTCCSGAVTRLAQLSHSITMMERKRQAARIQRGRPERL